MTAIIRRYPNGALTLVEPFYRSRDLLEEVEALGRYFWDAWQPAMLMTSFSPRLDMHEEKDALVVRAELPGIKKEDLDVSLDGDMLTIKAEKKEEEVAEEATYHTTERRFGYYSRSVSLPVHVDADKVAAAFKDGILEIKLPKTEEAKPRHIEVKLESPKRRKTGKRTKKAKES